MTFSESTAEFYIWRELVLATHGAACAVAKRPSSLSTARLDGREVGVFISVPVIKDDNTYDYAVTSWIEG